MNYNRNIQEELDKIRTELHFPIELLEAITNDYVKKNKIEIFVKNVEIRKEEKILGGYDYTNGTIFISWPVMIGMTLKDISLNKFDPYYYLYIETLYHELTHAKQASLVLKENGISNVLRTSYDMAITHQELYQSKEYYPYFPHEYNAYLESKVLVKKFCDLYGLKETTSEVKDYILDKYKNGAPMTHICHDYEEYGFLSERERIQYGLPVKDETLSLISKCDNNKIKRYIKC